MIRWAAGLARRAGGAVLLLLLLVCGAEVAVRLSHLRASRQNSPRRGISPAESITAPSWMTYHELRPLASIRVNSTADSEPHVVRINSLGLRGTEAATPKPADVYRILCLGDERLLAVSLAEENQLCDQLRLRLQPETKLQVEVWNAGIPGACPLTEFLLLTHRLAVLQPDLVLTFVQPNDLAEDMAYRRTTRMDRQGIPLACRHPLLGKNPKPSWLTACREEFRLVDLGLHWAGNTWKKQTAFDHALDHDGSPAEVLRRQQDRTLIDRTIQPLAPMAAWCRNSYATLGLIFVNDGDSSSAADAPWNTALKEFAEQQKLMFVPLTSGTETAKPQVKKSWSVDEHRDFADEIARRLLQDVSGPWSSPYFRPDQTPVTPAAHRTGGEPPRTIHHASPSRRKSH